MSFSQLELWEQRLRDTLDNVDEAMELQYQSIIPKSPRRPDNGTTSKRKFDGIFSIEAKFSLGLVSGDGPGYIIELRTYTLGQLPAEVLDILLDDLEHRLPPAIAEAFPDQQLTVTRKGSQFRLSGDLSF